MKFRFLPILLLLAACAGKDAPKAAQFSSKNLTEQGYALLAKEQAEGALPLFGQAIEADDRNVRAYQGKGIALNKLGRHEEAEDAYKKALDISPGAVNVTNNLAMSKILSGQYQAALDLLMPLAKGGNATVGGNIALAQCMLGKRDEARQGYSKTLPPAQVEENLRFCNKVRALKK